MPIFICPNCGDRSVSTERTAGFQDRARGLQEVRLRLPVRAARRLLPGPQRRLLPARPAGPADRHRPRRARADRPRRPRRDRPPGAGRARARVRERRRPHRHRARVGRARARQAGRRCTPRATAPSRPRRTSSPPTTTTAGCCWCSRRDDQPHPQPVDPRDRGRAARAGADGDPARHPAVEAHQARPRPRGRHRARLRGRARRRRSRRSRPQAIDDAIETIRKRTDSLGVSEPEIQRAGRDQISVGLPDVQNAERAKEQVGTTAQLQFYDWEPNVLTDREIYAGGKALYQAAEAASKEEAKAEQADVAPGSGDTPEEADRQQQHGERPLLPLRPRPACRSAPTSGRCAPASYEPSGSVQGAARRLPRRGGRGQGVRRGHRVPERAGGARPRRAAGGLARDQGPRGHRGRRAGAHAQPAAADQALHGARGRLRALGRGHQEPRGQHRPEHERPARDDGVHRRGPQGLRARDQADRRARLQPVGAAARASTGTTSPAASRSRSTTRSSRWPDRLHASSRRASTGEPAPRSRTSATSRRPTTSPRACASARCRSTSS